MFHVIKARLEKLARTFDALRQDQPSEYAAWYGWHATRVAPGTWRYRDPRFDSNRTGR